VGARVPERIAKWFLCQRFSVFADINGHSLSWIRLLLSARSVNAPSMVIKEPEAKGFKKVGIFGCDEATRRFAKAAAVSLWNVLQF
jgi:hypothetical protein